MKLLFWNLKVIYYFYLSIFFLHWLKFKNVS